jgi:hypothetical protein
MLTSFPPGDRKLAAAPAGGVSGVCVGVGRGGGEGDGDSGRRRRDRLRRGRRARRGVDWKSDVAPTPRVIEHYRGQVRAYLEMTGVGRGLIVFATTGVVVPVTRAGTVEAGVAAA